MSILARCSITVSIERDVESVYRFYKLQASTASAPAKPTTKAIPPSGWSKTEPAYTEGSTNSLYTVDLTIFTDGDFSYSDVCLSSSYEAAKQAYNKAVAAQSAASAAATTANSKNAIFYATSAPSGTHKTYDIWFDTDDDNKMYYWNGSAWTAKEFGTSALAEECITADLIAANAVTGDKIVARAITAAKIATATITANEIAANTITADKMNVTNLSAIAADLGSITGGSLNIGSGKFVVTNQGALTATEATITGSVSATSFDINGSSITTQEVEKDFDPSWRWYENGYPVTYPAVSLMGSALTVSSDYFYVDTYCEFSKVKAEAIQATYCGAEYLFEGNVHLENKYLQLTGGTLTGTLYGTNAWMKKSSGEIDMGCHHSGLGDLKLYQVIGSTGSHGLYSNGYWNGSALAGSGRWLIARTTSDSNLMEGNTYLTGNFTAQSSAANTSRYIRVTQNAFGGTDIDMEVGSSGIAGIWSNKYWNGSAAVSSGIWLLNRGTDGLLRVRNYEGTMSYPLVSMSTTAGNRIGGMSCASATSMTIRGDWGSATSPKYMSVTVSSSDPRLKENIEAAQMSALDLIDRIHMHSFDWKADGKHWDVGFIAPELYEIDPNLAIRPDDEDEGYWGVDDFYLTGIQTKAIQELHAEIKALKGRIAELELKKGA